MKHSTSLPITAILFFAILLITSISLNIIMGVKNLSLKDILNKNTIDMGEHSFILRTKERHSYDAILRPLVFPDDNRDFGFCYDFFNYGDGLQINHKAIENCFISRVALSETYEIISRDDILFPDECFSEQYGIYGKCTIRSNTTNKLYKDVFISPLAWRYLNSMESGGSLLLAVFKAENRQKVVIYLTDYVGEYLYQNAPELYITSFSISFGVDDSWDRIK